MRILDRYVFKSVLHIFISCIFVFIFLYVVIDLLTNLEDIIRFHVALETLVRYYFWFIPIMFLQVAPFASLLATLYTFGKLNHENEIIAMRSSGLSVTQITRTVIVLGALISLFAFWTSDRVVPQALLTTKKLRDQMWEIAKNKKDKRTEIVVNLSMYGLKNRLYFINKFSTLDNTMEGITILEQDRYQNITKKIVANKGVYIDGAWTFYQCITYDFDLNGQVINEPQYYDDEIMDIPETPQDFINQRQRAENMDLAQMQDYMRKLAKSGANSVVKKLKVAFYQRIASPFTNLIIILLGIPFSLMMHKRATGLSSIGLSIMVGFLYYIVDAIFVAVGIGGALLPSIAVSASHIIAFSYAAFLIYHLP